MGTDITIGADGSLILTPEILAHLRARPGQKLRVSLAEEGRILLSVPASAPGAQLLRGMLDKKTDR